MRFAHFVHRHWSLYTKMELPSYVPLTVYVNQANSLSPLHHAADVYCE